LTRLLPAAARERAAGHQCVKELLGRRVGGPQAHWLRFIAHGEIAYPFVNAVFFPSCNSNSTTHNASTTGGSKKGRVALDLVLAALADAAVCAPQLLLPYLSSAVFAAIAAALSEPETDNCRAEAIARIWDASCWQRISSGLNSGTAVSAHLPQLIVPLELCLRSLSLAARGSLR